MDSQLQVVKAELEAQAYNNNLDQTSRNRIYSLAQLIVLVRNSAIGNEKLNELITHYKNVVGSTQYPVDMQRLNALLVTAEHDSIDFVLGHLRIGRTEFDAYWQEGLRQTHSFGYLLAFVVFNFLQDKITKEGGGTNLKSFQQIHVDRFFKAFGISMNKFSRGFSTSMISQNYLTHFPLNDVENELKVTQINLNSLTNFSFHLCSNSRDYMFVNKLSKVYDLLPNSHVQDDLSSIYLNITCTLVNEMIPPSSLLPQGKVFQVTPLGLVGDTLRKDKMVVFGTHRSCDIRFPEEDKALEDVMVCLYMEKDAIYIVDCSISAHASLKLIPHQKYPIKQDMVFNIAQKAHFFIKKIVFDQNDGQGEYYEEDNSQPRGCKLSIEYLDGPFKGLEKTLQTLRRDGTLQTEFTLGRGACDIFCSIGLYVGARHLSFFYENDQWFIKDHESKNGTFILFKNRMSFDRDECSEPYKAFENQELLNSEQRALVFISDYSFLISSAK